METYKPALVTDVNNECLAFDDHYGDEKFTLNLITMNTVKNAITQSLITFMKVYLYLILAPVSFIGYCYKDKVLL
ncbi:hypothetical protein IPM62_01255 [Candidatus Woesebacteria bacterium]|nr:MAG: hypothetical protein IPM62_01255 [Candidatus Woesebacteria bacterium]